MADGIVRKVGNKQASLETKADVRLKGRETVIGVLLFHAKVQDIISGNGILYRDRLALVRRNGIPTSEDVDVNCLEDA